MLFFCLFLWYSGNSLHSWLFDVAWRILPVQRIWHSGSTRVPMKQPVKKLLAMLGARLTPWKNFPYLSLFIHFIFHILYHIIIYIYTYICTYTYIYTYILHNLYISFSWQLHFCSHPPLTVHTWDAVVPAGFSWYRGDGTGRRWYIVTIVTHGSCKDTLW